MLKKIVLGTLLIGLIAILVIGGINRTLARSSEGSETHGNTAQSVNGGGYGQGQGQETTRGNRNQGNLEAQAEGVAQAGIVETVELTGQVTSVDTELLKLSTASGETVEIANRAWLFAQEQGFTPLVGDSLALTGFYDTEERLEVSRIQNQTNGQTLVLRDENGHPMWAGRGRRG